MGEGKGEHPRTASLSPRVHNLDQNGEVFLLASALKVSTGAIPHLDSALCHLNSLRPGFPNISTRNLL